MLPIVTENFVSPSRLEPGAAASAASVSGVRPSDYVAIARPDHWVKNVFALPGIAAALALDPSSLQEGLWIPVVIGFASLCLVASSNYVLNETLDAPTDRYHPEKWQRPIAAGRVKPPVACAEWLLLMAAGMGLAVLVSTPFAATMLLLWIMGCLYNIPPIRSKDLPYVDVLSESVNNPLRMLAGWYMVSHVDIPPATLLFCYWMVGAYFMAIKRLAEYRMIGDSGRASRYRKSFAHYTEPRLLISICFYSSAAMLFFGGFLMRYRLELVFVFPFIAWVMAAYLAIGLKNDSAAQAPERLYREPQLMAALIACLVMFALMWTQDLPALRHLFAPTVPAQYERVLPW
jgi:decaprenyl-phosphate phosphoribosyltransferase